MRRFPTNPVVGQVLAIAVTALTTAVRRARHGVVASGEDSVADSATYSGTKLPNIIRI